VRIEVIVACLAVSAASCQLISGLDDVEVQSAIETDGGPLSLGSTCKAASECAQGTCDRGICRKSCDQESDCDYASCVAAAGPDGKPSASAKVCWQKCDKLNGEGCADGS